MLAFPKPIKKEKKPRWGVYRKNPLPVKSKWTGNPLLEPPYQGHKLDKVTEEMVEEVIDRSKGKCEYPGCNHRGEEFNHIAGRSRKAHANNINYLCIQHHRLGKDAFHAYGRFYKYCMKKYQDWCFKQGFTEDEVRFLLATKDRRLF